MLTWVGFLANKIRSCKQQLFLIMTSTCLLCYEDNQYFVLPPCNHKDICWKCCLKLIEGSIFSCPFCKSKPEIKSQLLFVNTQEMQSKEYQVIMKSNPFRSNKNTYYYYSNEQVAEYIEAETSFHCVQCGEVHQTINLLKRHLNNAHKLQFCDVCLDNRRCINIQQRLFTEGHLQIHLKQGDVSQTGEVILYHPGCELCNRRFYDLQAFKLHLKMSSHMKCQICDLNSPKLHYVYYKNYDDLERHHKKTHFICDVGDCVGKKLENVFASEGLLEEHKRRCHKKYKGDKNEKVQNIILGFNKNIDEDHIEFDGIGRNLEREFNRYERQDKVDKQVHHDELIDIREFYPEIVKTNLHIKIEQIVERLDELHQNYGNRAREIRFNDVLLFKPLEMAPLSRGECQRLLRRCFSPRQADGIIEIFFTKRHEYLSFTDYFQAIEKKMKSTSIFAFYLVFPQLIRFMKDENKNKVPMDEYYGLKLRVLTVKKQLMFHVFDRYSHFLNFLKRQLETELINRFENNTVDLEKYCKYMQKMSINYYIQNQDDLYFVPKEKCTNLYHMIQRSKTKDFLKMNWLLKVGLPQQKYQHLMKNIFFKTREECSEKIFKPFYVKEIALIYIYVSICHEALLDQRVFESNKKNPRAHYLTDFLSAVPRPATISVKQLSDLRGVEEHSNAIERKAKQRVGRVIVIDEVDCPSLLQVEFETNPGRRKPPEQPQFGIGKSRLPIWNEQESIRRKNLNIKPQEPHHEQEFPTLAFKVKPNQKEGKSFKKEEKAQEEDFPIYNFQEKYVAPKAQKGNSQPTVRLQNFIGFNSRTVTREWNQNRTRERFDQIQKEKEQQQQQAREQRRKKQELKKLKPSRIPSEDEDEDAYLRMAIAQSLKTAAQEQTQRNTKPFKQPQVEQIIIPRKEKIMEQNSGKKNKKNAKQVQPKKEEKKEEKKEVRKEEQSPYLFEVIEKEAEVQAKKQKIKKIKMRVDYSDSEDEPSLLVESPSKRKPVKKQEPINVDEFMPMGSSQGGQSIITRIQNQSSTVQVQKNNKRVKHGKNGKKMIIESYKMY